MGDLLGGLGLILAVVGGLLAFLGIMIVLAGAVTAQKETLKYGARILLFSSVALLCSFTLCTI